MTYLNLLSEFNIASNIKYNKLKQSMHMLEARNYRLGRNNTPL